MRKKMMKITISRECAVFSRKDIEQAASEKVGRPVKISELCCEMIDFLNSNLRKDLEGFYFDEEGCSNPDIELGSTEFWIGFPFGSEEQEEYEENGGDFYILESNVDWPEIKYPYHTPEKYIFSFDISLFQSFERWDQLGSEDGGDD